MEGGRVPPQNLEAETSVLGSVLLSEAALDALILDVKLKPNDFYRERHFHIFKAMLSLREREDAVDALTVTAEIEKHGLLDKVGGPAYVHSLPDFVPVAGNVRHYGRIVRDQALLRGVLDASRQLQEEVFSWDGDASGMVDRAELLMSMIADDRRSGGLRGIDVILHDELDRLDAVTHGNKGMLGVPSGFIDIDQVTGGFQPGNLIVLAARPAMGKSAMVANIAEHVTVKHKITTGLFSLEMSEAELAQRFIASLASLRGDDLRRGLVSAEKWPKVVAAAQKLAGAPLFVDDSADLSLLDLRAKARRIHQREPLGLVIVDYLQLMRAENPQVNRVEQISTISRGLKIMAREMNIPVIAVSQLSRAVEQRPDKRPMLSDLRDSGAIEQDADVVMFIYRDDYYHQDSDRPGEADVIISKHRNGPLADVPLAFIAKHPKFMDLAHA